MRVVKLLDIIIEYVLMLAFAVMLVAGVFRPWCFVAAAIALAGYFIWGALRLRCPKCGGQVEPGALLRGIRHGCHCPECGHEIIVVTRVNRSIPEKRGK